MPEYILYLEPVATSELYESVNHFLKSSAKRFYPTTATKYHCHVTMTGFFNITAGNEEAMTNMLTTIFENTLISESQAPKVEISPFLVRSELDRLPVHLLLPIVVPDSYRDATKQFAKAMQASLGIIVRPKRINHISLAYWDEPNATQEQEQEYQRDEHILQRMYSAAVSEFDGLDSFSSWQIVLYERVIVGSRVGEPHVFDAKWRWAIPSLHNH